MKAPLFKQKPITSAEYTALKPWTWVEVQYTTGQNAYALLLDLREQEGSRRKLWHAAAPYRTLDTHELLCDIDDGLDPRQIVRIVALPGELPPPSAFTTGRPEKQVA